MPPVYFPYKRGRGKDAARPFSWSMRDNAASAFAARPRVCCRLPARKAYWRVPQVSVLDPGADVGGVIEESQCWYQAPAGPYNAPNADIVVWLTMAVVPRLLILVPYLPGRNRLRAIWERMG